MPGPGPYVDRTRIGRITLTGPVIDEGIDARWAAAQDAFPTVLHPEVPPAVGEHFLPSTDRFGTAAFSAGSDLTRNPYFSENFVTADSIKVYVGDVRGAGGVTAVEWYGTIVKGPHHGKAPPPWTVGANGFFQVPAEPVRLSGGSILEDFWFVDLDDFYFRGGDVLHYVWFAEDALGGMSSLPVGLTNIPTSVEEAQEATRGMYEVSFLPTIDWDPGYLARIASDDHGDLEPTPTELANSSQANCILYVQFVNTRRRSGDVNRTSFMHTLDALGYRGFYDVYDHTGLGNTNNQLGGRATIQQAEGYNLIMYDTGNSSSTVVVPDGSDFDSEKIDQLGWFQDWLAQASTSEAGVATLWMIGSNFVQTRSTNALYSVEMGIVLNSNDQALNANPDVLGVDNFTFDQGAGSAPVAFTGDEYSLNGGCPVIRNYDGYGTTGSAAATHVYRDPVTGTTGDAGIVMNSSADNNWNTIAQSHPWFDIRDLSGGGAPIPLTPQKILMGKILTGVLPVTCQQTPDPSTDVPDTDELDMLPNVTALYQNIPNPFNPMTRIEFDLARDGQVSLKVYDVAGRLVRTLVNRPMERKHHEVVWDGLDNAGVAASSGIYFYRLETTDFTDTRKMVVLR
jgi:hypothetical protein